MRAARDVAAAGSFFESQSNLRREMEEVAISYEAGSISQRCIRISDSGMAPPDPTAAAVAAGSGRGGGRPSRFGACAVPRGR